jgi:hypothetical protein
LLALGIVLVFAEGLGGRVPTMRDFSGFTFPSRAAFRALFEGGDLSSWNPLAELGLSRLAAPVHGALYPGHVLLLAGDLASGVVLTWTLHAAWAAVGGYFLARVTGVRPFAAVAVLFLLLAWGRHTPLNALFCQVVPGLSLFRYPEKHLVAVVGLLGLLAALGAEEALSARVPTARLLVGPSIVLGLAMMLAPAALRVPFSSGPSGPSW